MTPDAIVDVCEVLEAVSYDDYALFKQRQAIVADLQLDERDVIAKVKTLQTMRLSFDGRFFGLDIQGAEAVPAVVIGALDADERLLDLVAWPIDKPTRLATLLGRVALLGEYRLDIDYAFLAPPVPVYRTALEWLRTDCGGIVPIEARRAARRLLDFDGRLVAEDDAHGRELVAARAELVEARWPEILVAEPVTRAAA